MKAKGKLSHIYDQVGLVDETMEISEQKLTLSAIDGIEGEYYKLETDKTGWSFSEPEQLMDLIDHLIKQSARLG